MWGPVPRVAAVALGVILLSGLVVAVTSRTAGADLSIGTPVAVPDSQELSGVACMTATACVAAGGIYTTDPRASQGAVVSIANSTAGPVQVVPGSSRFRAFGPVACASATTCFGVTGQVVSGAPLEVVTVVGGTVQTSGAFQGAQALSIACPGTATCVAPGFGSSIFSIVNGAPNGRRDVQGATFLDVLTVITCPSANLCIAGGDKRDSTNSFPAVGEFVPFDPNGQFAISGLQTAPGFQKIDALSCGTPTTCEVAGTRSDGSGLSAVATLSGTTLGALQPIDAVIAGMACVGDQCVAVGSTAATTPSAVVVGISGGIPGIVHTVAGTRTLTGVSCPLATSCLAVGKRSTSTAAGSEGVFLSIDVPPPVVCAVTSTRFPPAVRHATQTVTVSAAVGLASITNVQITNGSVRVPPFTVGTTSPVNVTATKKTEGQTTTWSFDATDVAGHTVHCV